MENIKTVTLTFFGTLEQGFTVYLNIGNARRKTTCDYPPPNLELANSLEQWEQKYCQLSNCLNNRIRVIEVEHQSSTQRIVQLQQLKEECRHLASQLESAFTQWLRSESLI